MGWRKVIGDGMQPVLDLVYPPRCPLCGDAIARHGALCLECWSGIETPTEPACAKCQRPLGEIRDAQSDCLLCTQTPPKHSGIIAATIYNDVSRQLILNYKHGHKLALAKLLARMMAQKLPVDGDRLLVPVPLHRFRLWERGFNQAAILCQELARLGRGDVCVDGLLRVKRTPSLGGLGKAQREETLKDAIRINPARCLKVQNRKVFLVDDVLTSGATSSACVDALLDAGAAGVQIVCFARVLD